MERQGGHKKQLINLCFSEVQVDPLVYNMLHEDPGNVSYSAVGGLNEQIRELRESIELPLMNPELFIRVGIKPPKVEDFFIYHLCLVVFFLMKVMVCHFVSDSHEVMTALIVVLPIIVVVEISLQLHQAFLLLSTRFEIDQNS
jgi:hypothetical protein